MQVRKAGCCQVRLTPVAHVTPASDVAVGIWLGKLASVGEAHRPHVAALLYILVQLHHADVVVDHCTVVAWMHDDFLNLSGLHERGWMVQVVDA